MPRLLQYDLLHLGDCPKCGAVKGEWCVSKSGRISKDYAHRARAPEYKKGLAELNIDRNRNGRLLPTYPLATAFDWGPNDLTEPRVLPFETEQILEAEHEAGHL